MLQVGLQPYLAVSRTSLSWQMLCSQTVCSPPVIWQSLLDIACATVVIELLLYCSINPVPALSQVVLQPYLAMVLRSLSASTSKYVKSAAPLPVMWRYMLELSVHSSASVDIQVSMR